MRPADHPTAILVAGWLAIALIVAAVGAMLLGWWE